MDNILQQIFWGNALSKYLLVLSEIFIAWAVLKIIRSVVLTGVKKLSGKTSTTYDDAIVSASDRFIIPYIYILINYLIIKQLNFTPKGQRVIEVAITLVTIYFLVRALNHLMHFSIRLYLQKIEETETRIKQFDGMLWVIKAVIWVIGFLFFLENIGYSVTTIVTGLGIGGIAIALAAQNILSDLFSYFVIFLDKPFEIGDSITVGDKAGTVEKIGFKTSRIRSIGGEQLVIPNAELVKLTINNFKRLEKRRIAFNIRVEYNTSTVLLKEIPGIIKDIIDKKEKTLFDRAHLSGISDYFLNFEIVYSIISDDYNLFMNTQQEILLEIITIFRAREIAFAIPTQVNIAEKTLQETKHFIK